MKKVKPVFEPATMRWKDPETGYFVPNPSPTSHGEIWLTCFSLLILAVIATYFFGGILVFWRFLYWIWQNLPHFQ